jgi:S-DNA-T family DNA segregation ATPase FtsK/SpoIIIE
MLHQWREAIRKGQAKVLLKGYSHVFVHTQQHDERDPSERVEIAPLNLAWQEVYGRDRVRDLVLAFARNESTLPIRTQLSDDMPWTKGEPTLPTRPVLWTAIPREASNRPRDSRGQDGNDSGGGARTGPQPPQPPEPAPVTPVARPHETDSGAQNAAPPVPRVDEVVTPPSPPGPSGSFAWAQPSLRETLNRLAVSVQRTEADLTWLQQVETKLRTALLAYNMQARIVGRRLTPNAALVRLQGSDRMRVADVEQKRRELLTTHGLNITSVLAEPGQVVVSIARPNRETISLLDTWRNRRVDNAEGRTNQTLLLGVKESDGELLYLCPGQDHAPHSLIAGTTGSGKSVLIQNLLLDIAATNSTRAAKIVLIDPKQGADYLDLQDLPHLEGGIIVSQEAAQTALEAAVTEMDRRYAMFRQARVANISRFNAQAAPDERLPVLWLVHDEFAVWMLTEEYKEMVSSTVQRLGVMARAAGIFLIFAAQRPEDRVMPLQLRDNLGNRLVLRVESAGTSVISLGEEGAERLLGKGHLAAKLQGEERTILAQVPILTPEQMLEVVQSILRDG